MQDNISTTSCKEDIELSIDATVNKNYEKLKRKQPLIEDITPSNTTISCENQLNTINSGVNKKLKYDDG